MEFSLALVTGATSGIGEALCRLLAEQGIDLLITGRDLSKLKSLASQLRTQVSVTPFQADLAQSAGRDVVIEKIQTYVPDLVINNAGFGIYGEVISHPIDSLLNIITVNDEALVALSMAAAQALIAKNREGTILNVSSVAAFNPMPLSAVYAASKAFVNHFSEAFDFELQQHGIRVLAACPGMVKTNFSQRAGATAEPEESLAMDAAFAAGEIWRQIQKGQSVHVFNWKYRLALWLARCLPRKLVMKVACRRIAKRLAS